MTKRSRPIGGAVASITICLAAGTAAGASPGTPPSLPTIVDDVVRPDHEALGR